MFQVDGEGVFVTIEATGIIEQQRKELVKFMKKLNDVSLQVTLNQQYGCPN